MNHFATILLSILAAGSPAPGQAPAPTNVAAKRVEIDKTAARRTWKNEARG